MAHYEVLLNLSGVLHDPSIPRLQAGGWDEGQMSLKQPASAVVLSVMNDQGVEFLPSNRFISGECCEGLMV
jgi:hypothetical protein